MFGMRATDCREERQGDVRELLEGCVFAQGALHFLYCTPSLVCSSLHSCVVSSVFQTHRESRDFVERWTVGGQVSRGVLYLLE